MKKDTNFFGDSGFIDMLTLTFIILKLCGVITWSWVFVLAPIWIVVLIAGIATIVHFAKHKDKKYLKDTFNETVLDIDKDFLK